MLKENNILLSIVIPTKDRYNTLIPVLKSMTSYIKEFTIEFVIQDNSDDNKEYIDFLKSETYDIRCKYDYSNKKYSIVENTILAIERARGKYLIFIGDDDLISPHISKILNYVNEKNIDCLVYNPCYYWWESVEFNNPTFYHKKQAFWCPNFNFSFEKIYSKEQLKHVLQQGGTNYYKLPRFYHGVIKKEYLERIKRSTGTYLPGSSPDMAFAISLALELEDYYYFNYPVSVFGASKNSGGGLTMSKKHYGKIEDQKFLPKNILELWDPLIPKIWSEMTIYPQTIYEVFNAYNINKKINYNSFYATMLVYEPFLKEYVKPFLFNHSLISFNRIFIFLLTYLKKLFGKYLRKLLYLTKKFGYEVYVIKDVEGVMNFLNTNNKFKINL